MAEETQVLDPDTLKFRRAVRDPKQAYDIAKKLVSDNNERTKKDAEIQRALNDLPPFNQQKLRQAGQGWRSNHSTGFLSSLAKRIMPRFKQAIDEARYLSSSSLSQRTPESESKTEKFRLQVTKTIRQWSGWNPFTNNLIKEDSIFGSGAPCWTDEVDWHPQFARRDQSYFPDGCPQSAKDVPLWVYLQVFMIHELADILVDPQTSEAAGWQIENLVKAIKHAKSDTKTNDGAAAAREWEDLVRETSIGTSYSSDVKVVRAYHLFIKEYTGAISHYIVADDSGDLLFQRLDRFESMEECLTLFTIEEGNGKLYGSKGAGRTVYNTHTCIEKARNLIQDNFYLAGLRLLRGKIKARMDAAVKTLHPFCVVDNDFEVVTQPFQVNVDAFIALDKYMTQLAELQVGAYMPSTTIQTNKADQEKSASEINYLASLDQQNKQDLVGRFYAQFMQLVFVIQKKIFSKDNILKAMAIIELEKKGGRRVDRRTAEFLKAINKFKKDMAVIDESDMANKEAVNACYNLLREGLEPEEIFELANCPPQQTTQDMTEQQAQALQQATLVYRGDPNINQKALMKRDLASRVGADIADELIIDDPDQTIRAVAINKQLTELPALEQGKPVPITPDDNDMIHMGVIMDQAQQVISGITPDMVNQFPPDEAMRYLRPAKAIMAHFDQHLQAAQAKGAKEEDLKQFVELSNQVNTILAQVDQAMASMPPEGAPAAPMSSGGSPPPGMPDMATPPEENEISTNPGPPEQMGMPLAKGPVNLGVNVGQQA